MNIDIEQEPKIHRYVVALAIIMNKVAIDIYTIIIMATIMTIIMHDDQVDDHQRGGADEEVGVPRINPSAAAPASRLLSSSFNWNPCRHHNWNHLYIIGRFCCVSVVCMSRFCLFLLTPLMGKLFWQVGKLFWQVDGKIILAGQLIKLF